MLVLLLGRAALAASAQEEADALVLHARAALQARDPARAAALLEQAYALYPAPEILFHLGEAQRQLPGGTARALRSYRRYLSEERQPNPALMQRALEAIAELSARQAEPQQRRSGPGPAGMNPTTGPGGAIAPTSLLPPAVPPEQRLSMSAAVHSPPPPPPRPRWRLVGLSLLGGGALLAAAGGMLLARGVSLVGEAREAESLAAHQEEYARARGLLDGGAAILSIAGAAVLVGGGLLLSSLAARGRQGELRLSRRGALGGGG